MDLIPDLVIIILFILSALIFTYIWSDKLYRIYFGLIFGFLLFSFFNFQIMILEWFKYKEISPFQNFLIWNKEMVLWTFTVLIFVFAIIFIFLRSELKSNKVFAWIFWSLFPLAILAILHYIVWNSSSDFKILKWILDFFSSSKIFDIIYKFPKLFFAFLIIIASRKIISDSIIKLLWYFAELISYEIKELKEENKIDGISKRRKK